MTKQAQKGFIKNFIQEYVPGTDKINCGNVLIFNKCKVKILNTWFYNVDLCLSSKELVEYVIINYKDEINKKEISIEIKCINGTYTKTTEMRESIPSGNIHHVFIETTEDLSAVANETVKLLKDYKCDHNDPTFGKTYHLIADTSLNKLSGKFLIMKRNGDAPKIYHDTRESVFAEYKRLKEKYPNDKFIISQII